MAYNLIITKNADAELDDIVRYIADHLDNPKAASGFLDSVEAAYDRLTDNPRLYQLCINLALEKSDYRKVVIGNYVMINRVDEERESVYILHFFYGRQDYFNLI